jgi:5-amino-6-(5-phosphoribosylamino)uracil reductase/diaminohydroxyphosphoribosylaminopyrimidine deaminase/5-amino-6-(5-phosphoribosylamino)uracil reductase
MVCAVEESAATELWPSILALSRFLASPAASTAGDVTLFRDQGGWQLAEPGREVPAAATHRLLVVLDDRDADAARRALPEGAGAAAVFLESAFAAGEEPVLQARGTMDASELAILRLYLPLVVGGFRARRAGRLFVTAHLAQTLDGRIACLNGHSHWISNDANLHHAHRLRALHDAVVVGGRTVERDDPQLTVRHVDGDDPTRVILNGSASVLRATDDFQVFGGAGSTLLCHADALEGFTRNGAHERVDVVPIDCPAKPLIAPHTIRDALVARGIHSAFLEGGGLTLSNFLKYGALDVLHIHVAPLILGPGIHGLTLPEGATVQAGRRQVMEHFTMDGELLLECREVPGGDASEAG